VIGGRGDYRISSVASPKPLYESLKVGNRSIRRKVVAKLLPTLSLLGSQGFSGNRLLLLKIQVIMEGGGSLED